MRFLRKDINRKSRNGSYYFGASVSVASSNSSNTTTAPFEEKWLPARLNEDGTYTVDLSAVYFTGDIVGRKDIIAFAESDFMSDGTTKGTLADLNDTNFTNLTEGQIIIWDGTKWINTDFQGGGDINSGSYVTLDTEQHISGLKWFDAVETVFNTKARVDGSKDSFENLPELMFHIPNVAYVKFKMDSGGGLHLLNGEATDFNLYTGIRVGSVAVYGGSSSQFLKADGSVDGTQYLPMTGGTLLNGTEVAPLNINTTSPVEVGLRFFMNGNSKGWVGYNPANGANLYNYICDKAFGVRDNGTIHFDNNTVWHAGNDGSGSGLDADLLDGKHDGDITSCQLRISNSEKSHCLQYMQQATGWNSWDAPLQNWFHTIKLNHGNGNTYYNRTLTFDFFSHRIYTGMMQGGTFHGWKTLAFMDDNVASATKLETARTLWGRPFDGTASISGNLDYVGDINAEYYSLRRTDINSGGFYFADKFGNNRLLVYAGDSEVGIANYTTGSWSAGITLREKGEIALAWSNRDCVTLNGDGAITFNQVNLQMNVDTDGYYFGTIGQTAAKNIHAGGLLIGPWWSDRTNIPTNGIYCVGNIVCASDVTAYSDGRLKSNIQSLSNRGFITPKTYIKDGKQSIGFIAQEVKEKYPELVMETNSKEKYLSLNYNGITAILEAQIIELNNKITELENKLKYGK